MAIDRSLRNSPRYLTLQHAYNAKEDNEKGPAPAELPSEVHDKIKPLLTGQEMLYSYFAPSLAGGRYHVTATQTIEVDDQKLPVDRKPVTGKEFHVQAPQYSLPEGAIHSIYPPSGSQVHANILPHILFTDPYLPWERLAVDSGNDRMRTPWLALLVFSQEELQLGSDKLDGDTSIFKNTNLAKTGAKIQQSPTFAIKIPVSELSNVSKSLYPKPDVDDSTALTDAIFVNKRLFNLLSTDFDISGQPQPNQTLANVSRYQYLAHVRHSRAEGLEATGEAQGLFGVVFSHRLAHLDDMKPSRAIVHLVSLEAWNHVDRTTLSQDPNTDFVILSSLFSWTYDTLPSNAPTVDESFRNIGSTLDVLRVSDEKIGEADKGDSIVSKRIAERLRDGFTLTKWRTQTGEETAALVRGALIPTVPPEKFGDFWSSLSFSGGQLQIFDKETGLMDISYSTAWSLGKTLALADQSFTTSLSRLRTITEAFGLNHGKMKELEAVGAWKSRDELIQSLATSMATLYQLANGQFGKPDPVSGPARLSAPTGTPIDLSRGNESIKAHFEDAAAKRLFQFAGTNDASDKEGQQLFNQLNTPNSTDWMIVLSWVLDRLFLFGIPAHYLIIEPSHLPNESLRFFYVDPHWMDALIDGALSIANHISKTDDSLRRIMKSIFNTFFKTVDPQTGYPPQIPSYGFLFRSHLVKDFPDLHVTAPFSGAKDEVMPVPEMFEAAADVKYTPHKRAPVLRQEALAEDTLFCLFDRAPGKDELQALTFTQPPHQQYFVVGDDISTTALTTAYKRTYTIAPTDGKYNYEPIAERIIDSKTPTPKCIFLWGENNEARFLNLPGLVQDIWDELVSEKEKAFFNDTMISAATIGYQLGSRIYQLRLNSAAAETETESESEPKPAFSTLMGAPGPDQDLRQFKMLNARPAEEESIAGSEPPKNVAMLQPFSLLQQPHTSLAKVSNSASCYPAMASATGEKDIAAPAMILEEPEIQEEEEEAGMTIRTLSHHKIPPPDAQTPQFDFKVYPLGSYNAALPSQRTVPQDIVFGITLLSGALFDFDLTSITVQVPMGAAENPDQRVNLLETYKGPGPVMLSNLRFNVLAKKGKGGYLNLTLLPRSTTGMVKIGKVRDCSFMMPLVKVLGYAEVAEPVVVYTVKYVQYRDQVTRVKVRLEPTQSAEDNVV